MYDEQGNLTRAGAEQAIREGGSVVLPVKITESNGTVRVAKKLFTKIEDLPDDATFAAGNPQAESDARARLEKQIADAQGQLQRLGPAGAVAEAKPEGDAPNAGKPPRAGKS